MKRLQASVLFVLFAKTVADISQIFEVKNSWNTGFQVSE